MPATANRIRIIGGLYRRRVLRFATAPGLRPTPDRVRETLFNWLGQDLAGQQTLDLYAGTGALSLEALSRGAARAVAVDRNAQLVRNLEDNAKLLGAAGLETHVADALTYLGRESRRFDLIFLDPPFTDDPWLTLLPACHARLTPGGAIYAEAGRALEPPAGLETYRHGSAGQVHYHLFTPMSAAATLAAG
jgi:16S rRNA (guanine966-N2)-methyltransferase